MVLFCPNCGKQMNDDARFCMGCGANLGNYIHSGVDINNNVIQRSQVGVASVGNVNISPSFSMGNKAQKDLCPKCGFQMKKQSGNVKGSTIVNGARIDYAIVLYVYHQNENTAFLCPKCHYKCISSNFAIATHDIKMCFCGGNLVEKEEGIFYKSTNHICQKCGKKQNILWWRKSWENALSAKELLTAHGWDVLI